MTAAVDETALRAGAASTRIARLREQMDAAGVDLAIVYGSGAHNISQPNACWYFSGVRQVGRDACLVVPMDGPSTLVAGPSWDEERLRAEGWIDDVVGVDDFEGDLVELGEARRWGSRRAGTMGAERAPASVRAAIEQSFGAPTPSLGTLDSVAPLHDALSQHLLRRSVEIAESTFDRLCEVLEPGMVEYELAAECDYVARSLGADDNFQFIAASQRHVSIRPPSDRKVLGGDVVLAELSPSVYGQFAQICRTAVVGAPSPEQSRAYDILREALDAGLAACVPGTKLKEVAATIDNVISEHGFGDYNRPPYMRQRGHGVGLGSSVPTGITARSEDVMEVGMSFVLHPNQYFPDAGYLLCGDQVVIDESGAAILARTRPQLRIVAAR